MLISFIWLYLVSLYNQISAADSDRPLFHQGFTLGLGLWILATLILTCSNICINLVVVVSRVSAVMSASLSIIIVMS